MSPLLIFPATATAFFFLLPHINLFTFIQEAHGHHYAPFICLPRSFYLFKVIEISQLIKGVGCFFIQTPIGINEVDEEDKGIGTHRGKQLGCGDLIQRAIRSWGVEEAAKVGKNVF